ncbi:unnamed protein product [Paramecium pentaurelia]|uniref:Synaptobrevin-like protein n=1 Tax=Paramecium pentaurelia TaxID=43138 RepID=A0A8S1WN12_9CILI|nr:unnamed protein product [Paramecium pentaurelia]
MILYTLISKGNLVLSEYTELEGDFTEMARIVLKSVKPNQQKQIFSKVYDGKKQNEYVFCITCISNLRFLCMIHNSYNKEKAFAFLDAILQEYQNCSKNSEFNNGQFSSQLCRMMKAFNQLDQKDALTNLEDTVEDLNESAFLNLRKMIEREVRLDVLVKKTEELTKNADIIFKFSRNVHRASRGNEFRFGGKILILSFVIFAILSIYIYYQI